MAFISLHSEKYSIEADKTIVVKAYEIAKGFIGVREKTGRNDGYWCNRFQQKAGIPKGSPYCYAFWYFMFDSAKSETNIPNPLPKTGLANNLLVYAAKYGTKVNSQPEIYDFLIWRKQKQYYSTGHIAGIIEIQTSGWIKTIEANTSINNSGNQREGNGICYKRRNINHPLSKMKYHALVRIGN